MKQTTKRQSRNIWLPLIALPIFLMLYYFLQPFFIPSLPTSFSTGTQQTVTWALLPIVASGGFLTLLLVHLVLFFNLISFKANLLFVLASLLWLLQIYARQAGILLNIFPEWGTLTGIRMILSSIPIMAILFLGIIHRLFPDVLQKWFLTLSSVLMVVFAAIFLIPSSPIASYLHTAFAGVSALAIIYIIIRLIVKLRTIRPEHPAFLCGCLIFIHGAVYDFLLGDGSFPQTIRFLHHNYMFIFFLFTSAALIIATTRLIFESNTDKARQVAQQIIAENQLDFQREQFGKLMENVESARFMRHDMKHHLAVINEYVQSDNVSAIKGYLEGMELGLNTSRSKFYCENYAVNAIVNHYISLAENDGVNANIKLNIPANTGQVKESDLCVIIGNLLENAVDACRNLPKSERFIRLYSYVQDDSLTFTMENSFDGEVKAWGRLFYSTKRDGEGIGLSSIQAVAEKYYGEARFEARETVFLSSVYVEMGEISEFRD